MIRLEKVTKIYKGSTYEIKALDNISLNISDGEFVAIMGKSGAGKSTLLNIIGCMEMCDCGKILFDDIYVDSIKKMDYIRRKKISFIFQNYELIDTYNVYENIKIPLNIKKIKGRDKKKIIYDIAEKLEIKNILTKLPREISGGEKQRTAIARAYVADKKYILADEPTGALDINNTKKIMEILQNMNRMGKTILLVTHDIDVANYANKIIELKSGHL